MARPKDESYVIDLCDDVLRAKALRGHRFDFLRGDPDKRGVRHRLPVDAYYPDLGLVVEYYERQHSESIPHMDRRMTVSGVTRGEQRKLYDQRRHDVLPQHGIRVVVLSYADFEHDGRKRLRRTGSDREVIAEKLRVATNQPVRLSVDEVYDQMSASTVLSTAYAHT